MTKFKTLAAVMGLIALPALSESAREAEDQTPTGKFLTATEVRPILGATQGSWIVVREFDGKDLLYFTHLLAWRCGLYEVSFAINDGEMQVFPMVDCDPENPMSVPSEATVYLEYPLSSIEKITIELLYDDLGTETAEFDRANVMTP